VGLVALTSGLAVLAGLCAFVIDYEQNLHRFARSQARRRAFTTGTVATLFFAGLGALLVFILFH